jgi:hypothetical protein
MLQDKHSAFLKPRSQVRFLLGAPQKARSTGEQSGNNYPLSALALALAAERVFARRGVA